MLRSESISKLTSALSKAQAEFQLIPKRKTGRDGNREFLYSDLADVLNEIRPKLNKYGIYLSHPLVLEADGHIRTTTRVDLEEEFIQSDGIRLSFTEGAGKSQGAEVTYSRRIDNNSFFGIFPDDDLDAPDLKPGEKQNSPKQVDNRLRKLSPERDQTLPAPNPSPLSGTVPVGLAPLSDRVPAPAVRFVATDNDLPAEMFKEDPAPAAARMLSPAAQEAADAIDLDIPFTPLDEKRNSEIQAALHGWIKDKTLNARNLSVYLDKAHNGKKQFDVPAAQWEDTFKKISDAIAGGSESVKKFFKENK